MTNLDLIAAAAEVRWHLLRDHREEPPEVLEIKTFFLERWPDIRGREVIAICKLAAPPKLGEPS